MISTTDPEQDAAEQPRRMTLSRVVELLLARDTAPRSGVTLTRNAAGLTQIDVHVRADSDDDDAINTAAVEARAVYDYLREQYPLPEVEVASVDLTRNAKGDTQIAVEVKTSALVPTLTDAREAAADVFTTLRGRFPMADGTTGAGPILSQDEYEAKRDEGTVR